MTFEDTLNELHAMLGRDVAESIVRVEPTFMLAHFRGVLRHGDELETPREIALSPELFFFEVTERPGGGFFLSESEFTGASWHGEGNRVLRVELGAMALYIEREGP
jgi:hypothetical protein